MTESEPESVDPALLGALRADFEPVAAVARERVAERLASSVGTLSLGRPLSAPLTPSPVGWARARSLSWLASFVLGGLCGAGLYGALRAEPAPRVIYIERATPPASVLPLVAASAAPTALPAPTEVKAPIAVSNASATPSASGARSAFANLAEQQALLDLARAAFARSDYPTTLALLKTHFQRFPKSVLSEEREALEIKALAGSGRSAEAHARAARFSANFPQSLLLPSINDSLHDNP